MSPSDLKRLTCWLLDVRPLWPGQNIQDAAIDELKLLSPDERLSCTRKMFIADARMSLGSALLKRLFVSKALGIPWSDVKIARRGDPAHGKPCAVMPDGSPAPIDFNVSHQAGLVTLIGWKSPRHGGGDDDDDDEKDLSAAAVGTDIVYVNERNDYRTIDQEGFNGWVDIYEEIFSEQERWDMKYNLDSLILPDGRTLSAEALGRHDRCVKRNLELAIIRPDGQTEIINSDILIDAKLRRFYAFFCYKEAYIKLTGEALLAPWLRQLEFQNVRSPKPGIVTTSGPAHGTWGEKVEDVDVVLHGKDVVDVRMSLQAFEENFMIATAFRGPIGVDMPDFISLDLEDDVLRVARYG